MAHLGFDAQWKRFVALVVEDSSRRCLHGGYRGLALNLYHLV